MLSRKGVKDKNSETDKATKTFVVADFIEPMILLTVVQTCIVTLAYE